MDEILKQILEEEARKLQETCIIKDAVEELREERTIEDDIVTEDIECEVIDEKKEEQLFEVYVAPGKIDKVNSNQLKNYIYCEDGSYVVFHGYINIRDINYNSFKLVIERDEFDHAYILSKPETWKSLLKFDDKGNYLGQVPNKVSLYSLDYIVHARDEDDEPTEEIEEQVLFVSTLNMYVKWTDLIEYEYEIESGRIVKKRSVEEFKEKFLKLYPYFEDTIKSLYGDNWDFGFHKSFNKYCLIIKFDKFTITNSKAQSHEITNLYFLVPITQNFKIDSQLWGGRETLSVMEKASDYVHSHLGGYWNKISSFCLGSGPISSYIAMFNLNPDDNNLFSVLYNIKIYVEWESIEGSPYRHFSNIGKDSSSSSASLNFDKVFKDYLIDFKIPLKIKVVNGVTDIVIDKNIVEVQLLKYTEKHGLLKVYKDNTLGTYQEQAQPSNRKEEVSKDPLLTYKGKELFTRTIKKEQIEIKDKEYVIHPQISEAFINNAITRIRKYHFKKSSGIDPGKSINYYI